MGMVYAAARSEALGFAEAGTAERLRALLARFGLPIELPAKPRSAYLSALRVDKKRRDSRIGFVVLEGIGRARVVPLTLAQIAAAVPRGVGGRKQTGRRTHSRDTGR